jgi:general stress protein YciG
MNDAEKVRSVAGDRKERRGFASMSPEKQREIASKGGRAAHQKGTAHEWTSEVARSAGRTGGQISRGGRGRLVEGPEGTMDGELGGVPGDQTKFDTSGARDGVGPQ